MAFKAKENYYGISADNLVLVSTTEGKTASVAEAKGEDGFVVANQVYAEKNAPGCSYVIAGNVELSGIKLGQINTYDDHCYALNSMSFTTTAGGVPTLEVAGQQVEDNATAGCTVSLDSITINGLHHAQTFGAFTVSGQGAHLTQSSMNIAGSISEATKDGVTIAHDLTDGRIEVTGTIQVSDASYGTPALSCASGWTITAPLTQTNPDSDYPTYTFTIVKYLTAD